MYICMQYMYVHTYVHIHICMYTYGFFRGGCALKPKNKLLQGYTGVAIGFTQCFDRVDERVIPGFTGAALNLAQRSCALKSIQ